MNNGYHSNEINVKGIFIQQNRKFNMADVRFDEFGSVPVFNDISNANKENQCKCCFKFKLELNVTLQELS
jgi:hypothetical protein